MSLKRAPVKGAVGPRQDMHQSQETPTTRPHSLKCYASKTTAADLSGGEIDLVNEVLCVDLMRNRLCPISPTNSSVGFYKTNESYTITSDL